MHHFTQASGSDEVKQICALLICSSPVFPNYEQEEIRQFKSKWHNAPNKQLKSTHPPCHLIPQWNNNPPRIRTQEETQFMFARPSTVSLIVSKVFKYLCNGNLLDNITSNPGPPHESEDMLPGRLTYVLVVFFSLYGGPVHLSYK